MSLQQGPTGCTIYLQLTSIINIYIFRAGLLLIMRRYYSFQSNVSEHNSTYQLIYSLHNTSGPTWLTDQ